MQGNAISGSIVAVTGHSTRSRTQAAECVHPTPGFCTLSRNEAALLLCYAKERPEIVLPSGPMSKWLCVLLLALAPMAQAAPDGNDPEPSVATERTLLLKLDSVRHGVVDRTSDLVITAMGFLGVPYRRGGNSAETGFDCSGLVRTIYGQTIGLMLPRRADQQAAATQSIDKKELQPGDLVFFNTRVAARRCVSKTCRPAIGNAVLMAHVASVPIWQNSPPATRAALVRALHRRP